MGASTPAISMNLTFKRCSVSVCDFHGLSFSPPFLPSSGSRRHPNSESSWLSFGVFQFCTILILGLGRKLPTFQIPDASSLILPTRINREHTIVGQENLLEAASRAFFVEQFNWIKILRSAVSSSLQDRNSRVIEFGPERCVPPTLLRRLNSQISHVDLENANKSNLGDDSSPSLEPSAANNDIAVIGMSCNVAGAQDLEEYWKILLEGRSQHRELVPNDRFVMETSFRPYQKGDEEKKWYAIFLINLSP